MRTSVSIDTRSCSRSFPSIAHPHAQDSPQHRRDRPRLSTVRACKNNPVIYPHQYKYHPAQHPRQFLPWGKRPDPLRRSPSPKLKELSPPSYHRQRRLSDAFVSQPGLPTTSQPPPPPPLPYTDKDPRPSAENPSAPSTAYSQEEMRGSTNTAAERRRGMLSLPISRDKISS